MAMVSGWRCAAWRSGMLAAVLVAGAAGGEPGLVLTRGEARQGPLDLGEAGVDIAGAVTSWASLAAFARPRQPATAIGGGVVLADGSILRGLPIDITQGQLRWHADSAGPRSDALDGLAAVIIGAIPLAQLDGLLAGAPGALLANGERVAGGLAFLNGEAVGLDTGRRVAQIPRGRVAAIVLRQPAAAASARTWLLLANGERVAAPAPVAAAAVVAGWSDGPGRRLLAREQPLRAGASDRLGAALPVLPGAGFPALVGGLAAPTGVVLPARGEIAWPARGAAHLTAWVACPADAAATIATVVLDGATAWERTLEPGAPAVAVAVPLKGAGEIVLRAAPPADGETARRRVVWAMPMAVE